jgi:hypothetical protein
MSIQQKSEILRQIRMLAEAKGKLATLYEMRKHYSAYQHESGDMAAISVHTDRVLEELMRSLDVAFQRPDFHAGKLPCTSEALHV